METHPALKDGSIVIPARVPQEIKDRILAYSIPSIVRAAIFRVSNGRYFGGNAATFYIEVRNGKDFTTFCSLLSSNKAYRKEALKIFADKTVLRLDLTRNKQCNIENRSGCGNADPFFYWRAARTYLGEEAYQASALSSIRKVCMTDISVLRDHDLTGIPHHEILHRRQGRNYDNWHIPTGYLRSLSADFTINDDTKMPNLDEIYTEGFTIGYYVGNSIKFQLDREATIEAHKAGIEEVLDETRPDLFGQLERLGLLHHEIFRCGRKLRWDHCERYLQREEALWTFDQYMDSGREGQGEWVDEEELLGRETMEQPELFGWVTVDED